MVRSLNVKDIVTKRFNKNGIKCVESDCQNIKVFDIGWHTKMIFCDSHGWKETVAFNPNGNGG